jgi:hypothetical protein
MLVSNWPSTDWIAALAINVSLRPPLYVSIAGEIYVLPNPERSYKTEGFCLDLKINRAA